MTDKKNNISPKHTQDTGKTGKKIEKYIQVAEDKKWQKVPIIISNIEIISKAFQAVHMYICMYNYKNLSYLLSNQKILKVQRYHVRISRIDNFGRHSFLDEIILHQNEAYTNGNDLQITILLFLV